MTLNVNHGVDMGYRVPPPQNLEWGNDNANCPSDLKKIPLRVH